MIDLLAIAVRLHDESATSADFEVFLGSSDRTVRKCLDRASEHQNDIATLTGIACAIHDAGEAA